jgi:FkbM family methyltransferase
MPRAILDLGANVGYTSAFFLSRYPGARVVAVEPDRGNYEVCCHNLAPFGARAKVIHGAAWPEPAKLEVVKGSYRDGRDWTTQVKSATGTRKDLPLIEGYSISSLITSCGVPEIDLLKIDIERSEIELFSRNTEGWLPRVRNLCIELHDGDCEDVFFRALEGYSYTKSKQGDLTVCQNLKLRQ